MTRIGRLVAAAAVAVMGLVGGGAQPSEAITFGFNCEVTPHAPGAACVPAGDLGTLSLTDSVMDPNRVDVTWALTPLTGSLIERVLLNYAGVLPGNSALALVAASAPVGAAVPTLGVSLICDNCQTLGQFAFDVRLSPTGLPAVFAGSLALFDTFGAVDLAVNLDAADFAVPTVPTVGNPGNPPLLAGYRTTVAGGGVGEFWAGVGPGVVPHIPEVPEPTTLILLGTGILGVGLVRRIGQLARTRRAREA